MWHAYANEILTVSTTVVKLTPAKLKTDLNVPAKAAYLAVEGGPIRIWLDGTDPTSTEGIQIFADGRFLVTGPNDLRNLKMIRSGTSDAKVFVQYFA